MDKLTKKKKEQWKKVRNKKRSKKLFEIVKRQKKECGLDITESDQKSGRCKICQDYKNIDDFCNFTCSQDTETTITDIENNQKIASVASLRASTETTITDIENNQKIASVASLRASTETTITDTENNQKIASVASPRASTETTITDTENNKKIASVMTPRGYQKRRVIERLGTPHCNETEIEKAQRESLLKSLCMMQGLAEKSKVQDGHELKMTAIACLKAMDQKGMLPSGIYDHKQSTDNVWDWILLKYEPEKVCILFEKLFVQLNKIVEESSDDFDPVMKDLDKPLIMDLDGIIFALVSYIV